MNYKFSNKVKNLKPSAIREIFKYAKDPQVVSLSAGNPSEEAFPSKAVCEISNKILTENPFEVLQYNITEGYTNLRNKLKIYMEHKHNIGRTFDEIIITSGAQQAIDILTKTLCNEGDVVICEEPSFIGALNTFRSYNTKLVGVPIEDDGINIEKLEKVLKSENNVKFIYTIPNFQNPSGITMSLKKRKLVYDLAKKYGVLILEDNPYGDLRYSGEYLPSIKSFDEDGLVAYVGSFSKVLSPGMRVGYFIAEKELAKKMIICKQVSDVHTNIWAQMVTYEFMENYNFDNHLKYLRDLYREKLMFTADLLNKYLVNRGIKYNLPNGGLFIWCNLPDKIDMLEFCKKAVLNKVCVVPGNAFLVNEKDKCKCFRMNFSTPSDKQLERGIRLLAKTIDEIKV